MKHTWENNMKQHFNTLLLAAGLIAFTTTAQAENHGAVLTDKSGMTLYTFDKDTKGTSNCYDGCAASWPPYLVTDESAHKGKWDVVVRKDGSKQWAFKGSPLYTWAGDQKAGDMTGDGVGGVWHVVKKGKASKPVKQESSDDYYDNY